VNMSKFLIIRFSSIGDIVLTTPVVRCVKNQINDSEVHFLTKKAFTPIVESNPHIDKVIAFDDNLDDVIRELASENYDFIIDLHNNLRSGLIKSRLKVNSASFNKFNIRKWLLVNLKINRLPDIHIVDRYMMTVSKLGVDNDHEGLDYFLTEKDKSLPSEIIDEIPTTYIAIVIGAKHSTKRLPVKKLTELCDSLDQEIILLGGPEDRENGELILQNLSSVKNYCGELTLGQSAFLISKASLVISHDTGLMHIAAAFRKKIISIWGNTVPEFGMYPYLPKDNDISQEFEVKGLKCRPCSKIGYDSCPKEHFKCMNEQDIDEIQKFANKLLN